MSSHLGLAILQIGKSFTNFLMAFLADQIVVQFLTVFGVLFQALLASLMNVDFTRVFFISNYKGNFSEKTDF